MTAFRLYSLYRRAGNSPCQAYLLANRAQPGLVTSAVCYVVAACFAAGAALLVALG